MSRAPVRMAPSGRCLRLSGVDWATYSRLLRAFAERPGVRLTYDRGELEIMAPHLEHDNDGRFLGRLIVVLTEELGLPLIGGGSTTLRRRKKQRGLEGDESFWIANAAKIAGVRRLDLRRHPPPDLALEVDVTRSSLNRLDIYAKLGVPELWRLDGDKLTFYVLGEGGKYTEAEASLALPCVTAADLMPFLARGRDAPDQNAVVREFREWVRKRIADGAK